MHSPEYSLIKCLGPISWLPQINIMRINISSKQSWPSYCLACSFLTVRHRLLLCFCETRWRIMTLFSPMTSSIFSARTSRLAHRVIITVFVVNAKLKYATDNWKCGKLQCPVWNWRSQWTRTHHILLHAASAPSSSSSSSVSYSSAAFTPKFTPLSNAHVTGNLRPSTDSQSVEVG